MNYTIILALQGSFLILLFTALEALMNRCVPKDYIYKRITTRKTELYSKKQIEEFISFDEKINTVLTNATNKSFLKQHPMKYTHISNLKEFRNMIVHTKEAEGESTYDYLFKKALTFNYANTLDAVKDFVIFIQSPILLFSAIVLKTGRKCFSPKFKSQLPGICKITMSKI